MTGVADARGTCRHSLAGWVLDQLVAEQVLAALRPGALELLTAAQRRSRHTTVTALIFRRFRTERLDVLCAAISKKLSQNIRPTRFVS
jgi:hypothetical protein